jgi:hypothetical protein
VHLITFVLFIKKKKKKKKKKIWEFNRSVVFNSKFLFVYRVKKNNVTAITCLQSRDYCSSVPVRYIPRRSSKIDKPESPLPIKGSKKNEFRDYSDGMQRNFVSDEEKSQNQDQMLKNIVLFDDAEQGMYYIFNLLK